MPFLALDDPVEVARARAAFDVAWRKIRPSLAEAEWEQERSRLARIITNLATFAVDEIDLARRAVERFQKARPKRSSAADTGPDRHC